jgi:hypothetical protein
MSQTTFIGKSKQAFYVKKLLPENSVVCEIKWKNMLELDRPQITK